MAAKNTTSAGTAPAPTKPAETGTAQTAGAATRTAGGEAGGAGNDPAGIAPASQFDPSGAPVQIVPDVDPSHPAVDADPRANTSVNQNRIDFNDPRLSGAELSDKAQPGQGGE